MMSGRLVAGREGGREGGQGLPMMKTFFLAPTPSISVRSWFMTRSAAPPPSLEGGREGGREEWMHENL